MDTAQRGDWVQIKDMILPAGERAPQVPEDTQNTALRMWVKGFLQDESAKLGDPVLIKTVSGRRVKGILSSVFPHYTHNFGQSQPELLPVGPELRSMLWGWDKLG